MSLPSMCTEQCRLGALVLLVVGLAAAPAAPAALGEIWLPPPVSGTAGNLVLVLPPAASPGYATHATSSADGTTVHEFCDSSGRVFAVTWMGPFKPDLQQLLGSYFAAYRDAPRGPAGAADRGTRRIAHAGVIVETGGRPRAFLGRAYVPALVPAGVSVTELP